MKPTAKESLTFTFLGIKLTANGRFAILMSAVIVLAILLTDTALALP